MTIMTERAAMKCDLRKRLEKILLAVVAKMDRVEDEHIFKKEFMAICHLPGYEDRVPHHIDIETIEMRCQTTYVSVEQLAQDAQLMLDNCKAYHGAGSYADHARDLAAAMEPWLEEAKREFAELEEEHVDQARSLRKIAADRLREAAETRGSPAPPSTLASVSASVSPGRAARARQSVASRAASHSPKPPAEPAAKRRKVPPPPEEAAAAAPLPPDLLIPFRADAPGCGALTARLKARLQKDRACLGALVSSPPDGEVREGLFVGAGAWSAGAVLAAYIEHATASPLLRLDEKAAVAGVIKGMRAQFDRSAPGLFAPAERRVLDGAPVWTADAPTPPPWGDVLRPVHLLRFLAALPAHVAAKCTRTDARRILRIVQGFVIFVDVNWEAFSGEAAEGSEKAA